jgi:sugar lactone lactonase YvrE
LVIFRKVFWGLILSLLIHPLANAHKEVEFIREFGGKGEGEGEFAKKMSFAFDRDGGIYIADTENLRIQKLDPDGRFLFEIQGTDPDKFLFSNPMDIAVGVDGTIYVVDWITVQVDDTESPRIFNYAPCVHRFDPEGNFVASYPLQDLSKRIGTLEAAAPALDAEGNYALIIPQGNTQRSLLLTVDAEGRIYVFDDGYIYKLDADGNPVGTFTTSQPSAGQLSKAVDMTVDREGNLYVVDEAAHRVLKYDRNGKFLISFGEYGDRAGQFISPFHLIALDDGTVLVADQAKYKKDYASDLPRQRYHPFQFGHVPYRIFRTRVRRVQRFYADGDYAEKILIRFQRENEQQAHLNLKAIDYTGNLYFVDNETLKFRVFAPTSSLISSAFQTETKLRYIYDFEDVKIDNQDDLDPDLGTKADFDERIKWNQIGAEVSLTYDINEDLRFSISNGLTYLRLIDTSLFRTPDFEDFRGAFNQNDETTETSWEDQTQIDFTLIQNHNPYSYREAGAFAYLNVTRDNFINKALDPNNDRLLDFRIRISSWGAGMRYDLGRAFQLQFMVAHSYGYNEYTYIDETSVLYATGFLQLVGTVALLSVDGVF